MSTTNNSGSNSNQMAVPNAKEAMKKVVSAKKQNLFDLNMKAVELGYNY